MMDEARKDADRSRGGSKPSHKERRTVREARRSDDGLPSSGQDLRLYVPEVPPSPSTEGDQDAPSRLSVVLPAPEKIGPFPKTRVKQVLVGVGVVAACTAAFFLLRAHGEGGPATAGLEVSPPGAQAAPAGQTGGGTFGTPSPASHDGLVGVFGDRADSVAATIDRFDVRRKDFGRGLIDCSTLGSEYGEVDRRFVALSEVVREAGGGLDSAALSRFRSLAGRAADADRSFGATGCPRP